MIKLLTILTFLFSTVWLFCVTSNAQVSENKTLQLKSNKTEKQKNAPYLQVNLDKETIVKWCQFFKDENNPCPKDAQKTNVAVTAKNLKGNHKLKYRYIISRGQIIGEGANVIWDFSALRPGIYNLKVIAEGIKNIHLESEIKTIMFVQCRNSCGIGDPCICPNLNVTSPTKSVKAGETIVFTANVNGGSQSSVTYNWTLSNLTDSNLNISGATIIEGQSTSTIKVKTTKEMAGETVSGTIDIGGVCADCIRTASFMVYVENHKKR